jgi:Glucosidase II beta subunit-like
VSASLSYNSGIERGKIVMALRQRKAKDNVLPLYNNSIGSNDDDESSSKRGRPAASAPLTALPRTLSKEGSNLLYTVYIPLIAFGFAYVVIGGGGGGDLSQRHHHRPVLLRPHKHYHQHTAGRMKEELGPSSITLKKKQPEVVHSGIDVPKSAVSPNQSREKDMLSKKSMPLETISDPSKKANHLATATKTVGTVKIRCPDGAEGILNDDYCDCADGSDESKTSACSYLTVQKSTFHCLDKTGTIYASRVRDGVKDCIDGSDEV